MGIGLVPNDRHWEFLANDGFGFNDQKHQQEVGNARSKLELNCGAVGHIFCR